jgi:hypothetical protein
MMQPSKWARIVENLLYLAARGHEAWGIDFVPVAIERAKVKAGQRGIDAHLLVANALEFSISTTAFTLRSEP